MRYVIPPKGRPKYGAKKTQVDGITFASQKEARRYVELRMLKTEGDIIFFHRQPIFDLPGGTTYRPDFLIFWHDGRVTYEDVKGHRTKEYIRAVKQVEALYPVEIIEK
jgi:hypothetical protein